jgi:uncharacterized protein (DUF169 family)
VKNAEDLAIALEKYVKPHTYPIGIQLLKSHADTPPNIYTVRQALRHKASLCQGFGLVRRNRLTFSLFKEDMVCPVGVVVMGLAQRPDYILQGANHIGRTNRTQEAAISTEREMNHFDIEEYAGLIFSPLDNSELNFDLALIYVNVIQVTRLIQAALYEKGGRFTVSVIPSAVCADALVPPVKTGRCSLGLPCLGDRIHTGTNENEMLFSIPASRFNEIAVGLRETSEGMPVPVPLPAEYELHSPERYQQYSKDIGLDG